MGQLARGFRRETVASDSNREGTLIGSHLGPPGVDTGSVPGHFANRLRHQGKLTCHDTPNWSLHQPNQRLKP